MEYVAGPSRPDTSLPCEYCVQISSDNVNKCVRFSALKKGGKQTAKKSPSKHIEYVIRERMRMHEDPKYTPILDVSRIKYRPSEEEVERVRLLAKELEEKLLKALYWRIIEEERK